MYYRSSWTSLKAWMRGKTFTTSLKFCLAGTRQKLSSRYVGWYNFYYYLGWMVVVLINKTLAGLKGVQPCFFQSSFLTNRRLFTRKKYLRALKNLGLTTKDCKEFSSLGLRWEKKQAYQAKNSTALNQFFCVFEVDLNSIEIAFKKMFGKKLERILKEETSGNYRDLLLAMLTQARINLQD